MCVSKAGPACYLPSHLSHPPVSLISCRTCPPGPHAACLTQPWLDAHGHGALETRKLSAASDCWCVSQPSSWRTRAPHPEPGPRAERGMPPRVTTRNWEGKSTRWNSVDKGAQHHAKEGQISYVHAKRGASRSTGKKVLWAVMS